MKNQVLEFYFGFNWEDWNFRRPNWIFPSQWCESWFKLKTIKSLMVNWGLNCTNQKPRTKIKKARKSKDVEISTGIQLHKIKSLKPIEVAIEPIKNWGSQIVFSPSPKSSQTSTLFRWLNRAGTPLQVQVKRKPIPSRNGQSKGCLLTINTMHAQPYKEGRGRYIYEKWIEGGDLIYVTGDKKNRGEVY